MTWIIWGLLFFYAVIFFMLEVSFKSFSKIALGGFIHDLENEKLQEFDFIKKHDSLLNAFKAFTFFLQIGLFIYSFFLVEKLVVNPILRIVALVFLFLIFFNFFLYLLIYFHKEFFLKGLIQLYRIPWAFFYPVNYVFEHLKRREPPEEIDEEDDDVSEKEMEIFFEESTKAGVIAHEDKEMIESVIEFGDTLVKEIMTPRVDMIYVSKNTSLDDLVALINKHKKSRFPVITGKIDNIEGIILSKDVFNCFDGCEPDFNISRIIRPAFFVPETMRIFELLKEMQRSKQKFAIVVDEFGGVAGLVTMEDVIEEIVGEIRDEYDDDTEQIIQEKDHYIIQGDTDIYELNERLNLNINEDEDYQTVSGFISYKLGKIPAIGDKIKIENCVFEVLEVIRNRIMKVKMHKEQAENGQAEEENRP